jgi:hypothetical protein
MKGWTALSLAALALPSEAHRARPIVIDPPPAIPDYLFALPDREWRFAELLWQGNAPCTRDQCEAGYHDGDLVVSVMRTGDSLEAVAGLRGCVSVSYRVVPPDELHGLSRARRRALISEAAREVAAVIGQSCHRESPVPAMDTGPLDRL